MTRKHDIAAENSYHAINESTLSAKKCDSLCEEYHLLIYIIVSMHSLYDKSWDYIKANDSFSMI